MTDDDGDRIQAVINAGCVMSLVRLLDHSENAIVVPALRSIGNIVTGTDTQTDVVIQAGALDHMKKLLKSSRNNIVKEAAWTISNITAGNPNQIQTVIDSGLFEDICEVLLHGEFRSQKESAWVITNVTSSGTPQQVFHLIEKVGILKPYCDLLDSKDARCILVVLSGLKNLFQLSEKMNVLDKFVMLFEELGALDRLDALQSHENEEVYKLAYELIEAYFSEVTHYTSIII